MRWSDKQVAALKGLWAEGLSASEIAARLGWVTTRNSVISKVWRLGLVRRVHNSPMARNASCSRGPRHIQKKAAKAKAKAAAKPWSPVIVPFPPSREDDIADGTLDTRKDDQCCFPIGDPRKPGFGYCKEAKEISSYCKRHYLRMYPGVVPVSRNVETEPVKELAKEEVMA